ncbi:MAG: tRNA (adenosine(37)-N6)-dimethylallyltransferase MiaA [Muribaculaceae bacterium]|nr:tRNA (adenosine(37)-N6)-dimethylallyltransferase MiaA [Muribaculaceae bacterium]
MSEHLKSTDSPIIAIVGPTASGKTHRAVSLAEAIDGEIISGDSRQVYRGMTIGTGKDLDEYGAIPYHLIDIADAGEKYNLHRFLKDADTALTDIRSRGRIPIVCGGTGLYIESLLNGLKLPDVPENKEWRAGLTGKSLEELTKILASMKQLHNVTDIDTEKRAIRAIEIQSYYAEHPEAAVTTVPSPLDAIVIGVDIDREKRRQRITGRLRQRLDEGMIDEIRGLIDKGVSSDDLIYYGLEYKYITEHVTGRLTYDEMFSQLEIAIHQFAKRQMTWFRGMERRGYNIHWLSSELTDSAFTREAMKIIYTDVSR